MFSCFRDKVQNLLNVNKSVYGMNGPHSLTMMIIMIVVTKSSLG
jgi:hypothetical protein